MGEEDEDGLAVNGDKKSSERLPLVMMTLPVPVTVIL